MKGKFRKLLSFILTLTVLVTSLELGVLAVETKQTDTTSATLYGTSDEFTSTNLPEQQSLISGNLPYEILTGTGGRIAIDSTYGILTDGDVPQLIDSTNAAKMSNIKTGDGAKLIYELGPESENKIYLVTKFVLNSHHKNDTLWTGKYEVYASINYDGLFSGTPIYTYDYTSDGKAHTQVVEFSSSVSAHYIGIKFLDTTSGNTSKFIRLTEIAVYGEYQKERTGAKLYNRKGNYEAAQFAREGTNLIAGQPPYKAEIMLSNGTIKNVADDNDATRSRSKITDGTVGANNANLYLPVLKDKEDQDSCGLLVYKLGPDNDSIYSIDKFLFSSQHTTEELWTGKYNVYASTEENNLFSGEPIYTYDYMRDGKAHTAVLTLQEAIEAKYVGIEFVTLDSGYGTYRYQACITEIAVYGTEGSGDEGGDTPIVTATTTQEVGYQFGTNNRLNWSNLLDKRAVMPDGDSYKAVEVGRYDSDAPFEQLTDGTNKPATFRLIENFNGNKASYYLGYTQQLTDNKTDQTDNFMELTFDLKGAVGATTVKLVSYKQQYIYRYEIFGAKERTELYNDSNPYRVMVTCTDDGLTATGGWTFSTDVSNVWNDEISYFGIRIYSFWDNGKNNRGEFSIGELQLLGSYTPNKVSDDTFIYGDETKTSITALVENPVLGNVIIPASVTQIADGILPRQGIGRLYVMNDNLNISTAFSGAVQGEDSVDTSAVLVVNKGSVAHELAVDNNLSYEYLDASKYENNYTATGVDNEDDEVNLIDLVRLMRYSNGDTTDILKQASLLHDIDKEIEDCMNDIRTALVGETLYDKPSTTYDPEQYIAPVWEGNVVYHESILFYTDADGKLVSGSLLYEPTAILSVKSRDLQTEYKLGEDYVVVGNQLVLLEGSEIPVYTEYTVGTANRNVLTFQVFVSYTHYDSWKYTSVKGISSLDTLTNLKHKLESDEDVKMLYIGDSITQGYETSGGVHHTAPNMPTWVEMVGNALQSKYKDSTGRIQWTNAGIASTTSADGYLNDNRDNPHGLENIRQKMTNESQYDLVVIAYGMNESSLDESVFQGQIEEIMNYAISVNPDVEFLLVSSMEPNDQTNKFANSKLSEQETILKELASTYTGRDTNPVNVVVAPVNTLFNSLRTGGKNYMDITGNCLNHPNDFGARLYAQLILETLSYWDN